MLLILELLKLNKCRVYFLDQELKNKKVRKKNIEFLKRIGRLQTNFHQKRAEGSKEEEIIDPRGISWVAACVLPALGRHRCGVSVESYYMVKHRVTLRYSVISHRPIIILAHLYRNI